MQSLPSQSRHVIYLFLSNHGQLGCGVTVPHEQSGKMLASSSCPSRQKELVD